MKKLLFILVLFCLMVTGCNNKNNQGNLNGAIFDKKDYETIEEMNEAAGTNIVSAPISGKSDESFIVIANKIAQYTFNTNEEKWCIRASKDTDNDISGLYYDSIGFEKDTNATYYTDDFYVNRFFNNGIQYVISLDVKDKDIKTTHFDDVCGEFQTNITGVKAGYNVEIFEENDNVIHKTTYYNDDGTATIMEIIYKFKNDKMTSITNNIILENEEKLNEYLNLLKENNSPIDDLTINGTTISTDNSNNIDNYQDFTKSEFIKNQKELFGLE